MTPMTLSLSVSEPNSDVSFVVARVEDPLLLEAAFAVRHRHCAGGGDAGSVAGSEARVP